MKNIIKYRGSINAVISPLMVVAMLLQVLAPMAFLIPQTASATNNGNTQETIVVTPTDLNLSITPDKNDWYFYDDVANTPSTTEVPGDYEFRTGPSTPPLGDGSVEMTVLGSERWNIATNFFAGTLLSDMSDMAFSTYQPSSNPGNTERAIYLNFDVDFNNSTTDGYQGRLAFVPRQNQTVVQDSWQEHDAYDDGDALWWWSGFTTNGNKWPDNNTDEYRSWDDIVTAFPHAEVYNEGPIGGQLLFRAGEPYTNGFTGAVDKFVITVGDHTRTYDFEPEDQNNDPEARIIATKIVCTDESELPNWGAGGPSITEDTAEDWVEKHKSCTLEEGWDFQWAPHNASNPGDELGVLGSPWTTFDSTDSNGKTQATVNLDESGSTIKVREVFRPGEGYLEFTGVNTDQDVSAEIYCSNDVLHYDNFDFIRNAEDGETYYCVAWNVLETPPAVCEVGVNLLEGKNGNFEEPVVTASQKWDIVDNTNSVLGWMVDWMPSVPATYNSENRPETAKLELHRGVNSWAPFSGEQYAELDTDWQGPTGSLNGEPASVRISQDIPTVPGREYELNFAFSPRPNTGAGDNILGVLWGGASATSSISRAGSSNTDWSTHSIKLLATTSMTRISFQDEGGPNSLGTFIDDVSLFCLDQCNETSGIVSSSGSETGVINKVFNLSDPDTTDDYPAVEVSTVAAIQALGANVWDATTSDPNAKWVWSEDPVTNWETDRWVTFQQDFMVNGTPKTGTLEIASDNSYEVWINGSVADPADFSDSAENNHSAIDTWDISSLLKDGKNDIFVRVKNFALPGAPATNNPGGLLFTILWTAEDCGDTPPPEPTEDVGVTVHKYLDGEQLEDEEDISFKIQHNWTNYGGGNGNGEINLNSSNNFTNTKSVDIPGVYGLYEVIGGDILGSAETCELGKYRLVGYSEGNTLEEAEEADKTQDLSIDPVNQDKYVIVWNETCPDDSIPEVAGVTICKLDNQENPLSNWQLSLLGDHIEGPLSILPDGNTVSSTNLLAGDYVLLANGQYIYRPSVSTASTSDAAYSLRLPADSIYINQGFGNWTRVLDFPSPYTGWLGIMVDSTPTDWGNMFNSNHKYASSLLAYAGGSLGFSITDDVYSDNSGSLSVDIYKGYTGVTDKDGCVFFENVPYGTYSIDEILQDGWTNVSGLVEVEIDEPTESFEVVNREGEDQCTENCNGGDSDGKIDLVIEKEVNKTQVETGDVVVFTITVENDGPDGAFGVVVNDLLPDGLKFVSANATVGSYNDTTGVWTVGDMADNEEQTLTITAEVTATFGKVNNIATVTSSFPETDTNSSNDTDEVDVELPNEDPDPPTPAVGPNGTDDATSPLGGQFRHQPVVAGAFSSSGGGSSGPAVLGATDFPGLPNTGRAEGESTNAFALVLVGLMSLIALNFVGVRYLNR